MKKTNERVRIKTREEWLMNGIRLLRPVFRKTGGVAIPSKVQVGCGWPHGGKGEVIGQCFGKSWTTDGVTHIFISPTQAGDIEVLAILVHELIHAAVGVKEGHKGEFRRVARALGLEGKLTATFVSEKSSLHTVLVDIAKQLGKYPHSKMIANKRKVVKRSWIRLWSIHDPEYTLVISKRVVRLMGLPKDSWGDVMVENV